EDRMTTTPLTVLDLVPISSGSNATQALRNSIDLAQQTERLGYARYWFAEHHLNPGVAGTSPAVVLAPDSFPGRSRTAPGEAGGQLLLPGREHVYYERAVPADGPQRQAGELEADQDERRVERQRGDRVGGGAHRCAVSADRRDHRDARCEVSHSVTELCGRDVRTRRVVGCRHTQFCP